MSFKDIISKSETLSGLPYIYVVMTLIELERMGILTEELNDNNATAVDDTATC